MKICWLNAHIKTISIKYVRRTTVVVLPESEALSLNKNE